MSRLYMRFEFGHARSPAELRWPSLYRDHALALALAHRALRTARRLVKVHVIPVPVLKTKGSVTNSCW